jgi:hypothetical protein
MDFRERTSSRHFGKKGQNAPADAKLTPLLTPPSAQHAATASDREQGSRLRRAISAAVCNLGQQASVDCGSREGRGFESRRSPSSLQDKHEGRGEEGSLVARPAHKLKVTVIPAPCLRLPAQPRPGHNRRHYRAPGARSISRNCLANRPGNRTLCKGRSLLSPPGRKR